MAEAHGEWIRVVPNKPPQRHQAALTDTDYKVSIFVSPFDIPTHARGYRARESGLFVIELKYIGEEPLAREKTNVEHLFLRVGKNSGRLYGIEVDVDSLDTDTVSLEVLVGEFIRDKLPDVEPRHPVRQENYDLATAALRSIEPDVVYA